MQWAAKNCFWGLKLHELKTLARELDVEPVSPDLLGVLEVIIQTMLPDATQDEIQEILMLRCEVPESPLEGLGPDILEALVPPEDFKTIEDLLML